MSDTGVSTRGRLDAGSSSDDSASSVRFCEVDIGSSRGSSSINLGTTSFMMLTKSFCLRAGGRQMAAASLLPSTFLRTGPYVSEVTVDSLAGSGVEPVRDDFREGNGALLNGGGCCSGSLGSTGVDTDVLSGLLDEVASEGMGSGIALTKITMMFRSQPQCLFRSLSMFENSNSNQITITRMSNDRTKFRVGLIFLEFFATDQNFGFNTLFGRLNC